MQKIRVGVLRGGPSGEYDISLKTGTAVLKNLPEDKYEAVDVFIDRKGVWHTHGVPTTPEQLARLVDAAFVALHGAYGEDGQVQRELGQFGIPYTGSGVASSATAMHKGATKKAFREAGIMTPVFVVIEGGDELTHTAGDVFRSMPGPYVVKPVNGGSSMGMNIVTEFHDFVDALHEALQYSDQVLVEEYINGKEGTCGVIENFRGEDVYALPPIEIVPPDENKFFDYDAKYSGKSKEVVPSKNFSDDEKNEMQELARRVHKLLGLKHYSRTDFILSPRGTFVLEVNTLPGLTSQSLIPKSVDVVGCTFPEFLDHLVSLALDKK